jgi:hypothetical protein
VDAFLYDVVPAIRKLVSQVTVRAVARVKKFKQTRGHVEECLRAGVVPSTNTARTLDPLSIINSAFCFYLTSLPEVIREFEKPELWNDVATHSRWTRRLEMWTMKAVEDSQVMTRFVKTRR